MAPARQRTWGAAARRSTATSAAWLAIASTRAPALVRAGQHCGRLSRSSTSFWTEQKERDGHLHGRERHLLTLSSARHRSALPLRLRSAPEAPPCAGRTAQSALAAPRLLGTTRTESGAPVPAAEAWNGRSRQHARRRIVVVLSFSACECIAESRRAGGCAPSIAARLRSSHAFPTRALHRTQKLERNTLCSVAATRTAALCASGSGSPHPLGSAKLEAAASREARLRCTKHRPGCGCAAAAALWCTPGLPQPACAPSQRLLAPSRICVSVRPLWLRARGVAVRGQTCALQEHKVAQGLRPCQWRSRAASARWASLCQCIMQAPCCVLHARERCSASCAPASRAPHPPATHSKKGPAAPSSMMHDRMTTVSSLRARVHCASLAVLLTCRSQIRQVVAKVFRARRGHSSHTQARGAHPLCRAHRARRERASTARERAQAEGDTTSREGDPRSSVNALQLDAAPWPSPWRRSRRRPASPSEAPGACR